MVNRRQTEALIRRAHTIGPAACTEPDATTWIWSDLHLGHEHSRSVFGRPFPTADAAGEGMMEAWYEQVGEDETIICLGDISVDGEALAHHQEWCAGRRGRRGSCSAITTSTRSTGSARSRSTIPLCRCTRRATRRCWPTCRCCKYRTAR